MKILAAFALLAAAANGQTAIDNGGDSKKTNDTKSAEASKTVESSKNDAPLPGVSGENIPDDEKIARVKEAVDKMNDILNKVIHHLQGAREEKDIVKLNCVNEKLTSIKGLLRIATQSVVTLLENVARKDQVASQQEYSKIMIAHQKCEQLAAESEACVGELAVYSGETTVTMDPIEENTFVEELMKKINALPLPERAPWGSPYQ
jgi:hypothetical protein